MLILPLPKLTVLICQYAVLLTYIGTRLDNNNAPIH